MIQDKIKFLKEKIKSAELVLVGIGEQFTSNENRQISEGVYRNLADILEGKNYFVITTCVDRMIYGAGLKETNIVCPLLEQAEDQNGREGRIPSWERYMMWLQGTLNRKLLVLELGVGLTYPDVIRFPFEKVVFYNQKAELVRIHTKLFQLPAELNGRGISFQEDAVSLLSGAEI